MKHLTILLTLAALAGAADKFSAVGDIADNRGAGFIQFRISDSLAFARFRADTAIAGQLWRQAAHQDSVAYQGRTQAQTIYQLAVQHLQQDTARKAP